jgi:hypothetical protein
MSVDVGRAIRIFYSYAHEDKTFRDDLERHFATLRRLKHIVTWYDRDILPGKVTYSNMSKLNGLPINHMKKLDCSDPANIICGETRNNGHRCCKIR